MISSDAVRNVSLTSMLRQYDQYPGFTSISNLFDNQKNPEIAQNLVKVVTDDNIFGDNFLKEVNSKTFSIQFRIILISSRSVVNDSLRQSKHCDHTTYSSDHRT